MNRQMANLNIRGGARPRGGGGDRAHGGRGGFHHGGGGPAARPIEEHPTVQVNAVRLALKPNLPIFKYDVRIDLCKEERKFNREITKDRFDSARQKCVALLSHAMKTWGKSAFVYNRASCLYSPDENLENSLTFHGTEVPASDVGDCDVTVTLAKASSFQTSTNDLASCININPGQHQPNLVEFINIVMEKQAHDKPSQWFSDNGIHYLLLNEGGEKLRNGMLVKPGVKTSAKVYGKDMKSLFVALVVDIKVGVVHVAEPLMNKYADMQRSGLNLIAISNILKGLNVITTYGERKQTVIITTLKGTAKDTFIEMDDGTRLSVFEYFAKQKKITLKRPDLPLVLRRKGGGYNYYPMELLDVVPNQSVRVEKMGDDVQEAVIKFSAMPPQVRLDMCQKYMQLLGLTSTNEQLKTLGVKIMDDKFIQVTANTLHAVRLHQNAVAPMNNVNITIDKFCVMPKVISWAIVNLGARQDTFDGFVQFAKERMGAKGIQCDPPTVINFNGTPKELLEKAQGNKIRYLMVVMDDRNTGHDEMKFYEMKTQIVTQIVKSSNAFKMVSKGQRVTMDNILMKLCIKNGGVPYSVESGSNVLKIMTNDVMYLGIEFSHQQPKSGMDLSLSQSNRLPSRVGYAATCANDPRKVLGDYLFLEPHEPVNVYTQIEEICRRCIEAFKKNRKALPRAVVIYVTGFSEGKWYEMEKEFKLRAKKGCGCNIVLIAVSKNHMERFYKTKIDGHNAREQNVSAGLAISDTLVSPVTQEFFLHPHVVLQGTAKTPKYTVLLNEPKVELISIMQATHALCFLHEVCTSAVSVPAVLTVADRCALRGQSVMRYYTRMNRISELSVEDANRELTNPTEGFHSSVRYNA